MKQYLGFDVGGTSIKVGVVEENARVVYHEKLPIPPDYDAFMEHLSPASRATYKVDLGAFLQEIGTNDFARVTPARMWKYATENRPVRQRRQAVIHLRAMLSYAVQRNINGAQEKVDREMLVWLLKKPRSRYEQMKMEV